MRSLLVSVGILAAIIAVTCCVAAEAGTPARMRGAASLDSNCTAHADLGACNADPNCGWNPALHLCTHNCRIPYNSSECLANPSCAVTQMWKSEQCYWACELIQDAERCRYGGDDFVRCAWDPVGQLCRTNCSALGDACFSSSCVLDEMRDLCVPSCRSHVNPADCAAQTHKCQWDPDTLTCVNYVPPPTPAPPVTPSPPWTPPPPPACYDYCDNSASCGPECPRCAVVHQHGRICVSDDDLEKLMATKEGSL